MFDKPTTLNRYLGCNNVFVEIKLTKDVAAKYIEYNTNSFLDQCGVRYAELTIATPDKVKTAPTPYTADELLLVEEDLPDGKPTGDLLIAGGPQSEDNVPVKVDTVDTRKEMKETHQDTARILLMGI